MRFEFKTKHPITAKQKDAMAAGVAAFNAGYREKTEEKLNKFPKMIQRQFGYLLAPIGGADMIRSIGFEKKKVIIELNDEFVELYNMFTPHLPKLFRRRSEVEKPNPKLLRNILRKAVKDYVELEDEQ